MQGHPNVIYNCGSVNVVFYSYRQHFRRYLRQIQVQLAVKLKQTLSTIFFVDPAPVDQQPPAFLPQPQAPPSYQSGQQGSTSYQQPGGQTLSPPQYPTKQ